jgi:hypothetical protein
LATTNHGGQRRIARHPNQGVFCSLGQKTQESRRFNLLSCAFLEAQKAGSPLSSFQPSQTQAIT